MVARHHFWMGTFARGVAKIHNQTCYISSSLPVGSFSHVDLLKRPHYVQAREELQEKVQRALR